MDQGEMVRGSTSVGQTAFDRAMDAGDWRVPASALSMHEPCAEVAGAWFVLHTKSRQEKALVGDLRAMGVSCFAPTLKEVRFYAGRRAVVEVPFFPCYIFLKGTIEQAFAADRTKRVANILHVTDQAELGGELASLALALAREVPLVAYPALQEGVRVQVRAGPLQGLCGVVARRLEARAQAPVRLVLQVRMLGQAVSLEVEASLLEIID